MGVLGCQYHILFQKRKNEMVDQQKAVREEYFANQSDLLLKRRKKRKEFGFRDPFLYSLKFANWMKGDGLLTEKKEMEELRPNRITG